jgi:hypothetical protein
LYTLPILEVLQATAGVKSYLVVRFVSLEDLNLPLHLSHSNLENG